MSRRKSVIGIAVLVVLVLSAFAAASASAEDRAYTCAPITSGAHQFAENDAHCVTPSTGTGKGFVHTLIVAPKSATTSVTVTNDKSASGTTAKSKAILRGTLSGLETEVECETVSGEGTLWNEASWTEATGTLTYKGCKVLKPAGRNCKVTGETITTHSLAATSKSQTGTNLRFSPAAGTEFAGLSIFNCTAEKPPAVVYPVSGSLVASTSGATTSTTEAGVTAQATLTFGGNPSGIEGSLTISMIGGNAITLTP
jgi:hypothetical protein